MKKKLKRLTKEQLKRIRENHGLTQAEFAKMAEVSLKSYQDFEDGTRPISVEFEQLVINAVMERKYF